MGWFGPRRESRLDKTSTRFLLALVEPVVDPDAEILKFLEVLRFFDDQSESIFDFWLESIVEVCLESSFVDR